MKESFAKKQRFLVVDEDFSLYYSRMENMQRLVQISIKLPSTLRGISDLYSGLFIHDLILFQLISATCFKLSRWCCYISAMLIFLLALSSYEVALTVMQQAFCPARCHSVVKCLLSPSENPADGFPAAVRPDLVCSHSLAVSGFRMSGGRTEKSRADQGPYLVEICSHKVSKNILLDFIEKEHWAVLGL